MQSRFAITPAFTGRCSRPSFGWIRHAAPPRIPAGLFVSHRLECLTVLMSNFPRAAGDRGSGFAPQSGQPLVSVPMGPVEVDHRWRGGRREVPSIMLLSSFCRDGLASPS